MRVDYVHHLPISGTFCLEFHLMNDSLDIAESLRYRVLDIFDFMTGKFAICPLVDMHIRNFTNISSKVARE